MVRFTAQLFLASCFVTYYASASHFTLLSDLVFGGQKLTVAIIGPDLEWEQINPGEKKLASHFLSQIKKWKIEQYRSRYPELPASFFESMARLDDYEDGRSEMVVIFKNQNIDEIQGTLRVAWTDESHPWFPSEKMLDYKLERPTPQLGLWKEGRSLWSKDFETKTSVLRLIGGIRELKDFVVVQEAESDLVPLLFYVAERGGVSDKWVAEKFPGAGGALIDVPVYPSTYVISCHKSMVPYYRRLGFSLVTEAPIQKTNYFMSISRNDFLSVFLKKFGSREGRNLIQPAQWSLDAYARLLNSESYSGLFRLFHQANSVRCRDSLRDSHNEPEPPIPESILKRGSRRNFWD